MPLNPKASIGENIKEFHGGQTYSKTKKKFGAEKANKQAIAVAYATKRRASSGPGKSNQGKFGAV